MATTELALPPKVLEIQGILGRKLSELVKVCSRGLSAERQIEVAVLLIYRTPDLQKCDPSSLFASVMQASSLGLDLSPARGEAYIVPRWNSNAGCQEATFMPGYRGLAKLAHRTGNVIYIQPELVHKGDKFRVWRDPDTNIEHEMSFGKSTEVTHVYAVAKLVSGDRLVTVLTRDEVEGIRKRSSAANRGPWVSDWAEMAKKTAVRRLCKSLPFGDDSEAAQQLHAAIEADNYEYEDAPEAISAPDNNSGHGKGMYASLEQTTVYLKALDDYLAKRNAAWLDSWAKGGEMPEGVGDLKVSRWQADNHLVKWAVETGQLAAMDVTEGVKNRQIGRFTAIVYHRSTDDRKAIAQEMRRYLDEQCDRATDRLRRERPELFAPEVESQETPTEDVDDGYQAWELEPASE